MVHMIPIIALKFVGKYIISNSVESLVEKSVKKRLAPKEENKRYGDLSLKLSSGIN
jgi:hypothetical protein